MILLSSAVRIYVAVEPTTMRRSFDGLMAQVRSVLARDALSGHVFAFINRRRNQVKLLMWIHDRPQAIRGRHLHDRRALAQ
jgi:transposase